MNTNKRIKCCYFPTTTVLVDDNPTFLTTIAAKIGKFSPCRPFDRPTDALNFINEQYYSKPFFEQFYGNVNNERARNQCDLRVDVSNIYKKIYDTDRFTEITGLVVDYAMPHTDGRQFCDSALKGCNWQNWNNIILLTGEAKAETALDMLKDQLINGYVDKRESGFLDKLIAILKMKQAEYFEKNSTLIVNTIADSALAMGFKPSALRDPLFINFFYELVYKYSPAEYYLIDEAGGYVFVSGDGELSWLIVQSEDDIEANIFEMNSDNSVPADIMKMITERKAIKHFFESDNMNVLDENDWSKCIYPAETLKGSDGVNYYYSYIQKPLSPTFIDPDKIKSYNSFKEKNSKDSW